MYKEMNRKLLEVQKEWLESCKAAELAQKYPLSRPFSFGVTDEYIHSDKRVMVVGQEAKDFGSYLSDWPIEDIQEFNKEYVEIQLGYKQPTKDIKRNNSPFWYLFRDLKSHGLEPVWNNVDKFHRLSNDNKTESLNLEIERLLNKSYGSDNKSLLTREIEISNPDIIVFVVGPYYHESMALSLGIEDDELIKYKPTKDAKCNCIKDIYDSDILVLWSYHPAYLNRVKSIGSIYENIKRRH